MGELKDKASRYSQAFNGASPLADVKGRSRKAAKIKAVLDAEELLDKPGLRVLDIGCAFGIILERLTPPNGLGVGIDMDEAIGSPGSNLIFIRADAESMPFPEESFDIVICNHMYEHTDDPQKLIAEINRVMKDDGACYFAGPNKYEPIEPHYGLPFLSWLPRPIADAYMRITGKGDCYPEKPYSHTQLRTLLRKFDIVEYTGEILADPVRFNATDILPPGSLKVRIARAVYRYAPFFFPGFVYVLRKGRAAVT